MKSLSPKKWTVKKKCRLCALLSYVIHIIHQIVMDFKNIFYAYLFADKVQ